MRELRHLIMALTALQLGIIVVATVLTGVSPMGTLFAIAAAYMLRYLWGQPDA